jgi:ribA/ribD-fused uncharacterized protein
MLLSSREKLEEYIALGHHVKYLAFWGHTQPIKSKVCKSCFSQWFESPFSVNEVLYKTAEHYMMAQKALLFGDHKSFEKIIAVSHPGEVKKIGREISGFSESAWEANRFEIVVTGNLAKFSQNHSLGEFLISSGERVLVEASPVDRIWGVGLAVDSVDIETPKNWLGLNLLGFALMHVRHKLQSV